MLLLAACAGPLTVSPTPLPETVITTATQAVVYQPTNAEGYNLPINLANVTLTCLDNGDFQLEFDYQPADLSINSIQDSNSPKTALNCLYPVPGHGSCSGAIDFPAEGITSLVFCHSPQTADRICTPQTLKKALCKVQSNP